MGTGSKSPPVFNNIHCDIISLNLQPILVVPVFVPVETKKAPTENSVSAWIYGSEGQNRIRLRRNTGIFTPNLWKFKNKVILSSWWFYANFSGYFWFRLELFGNICPWRAQFGHNLPQLRIGFSLDDPIGFFIDSFARSDSHNIDDLFWGYAIDYSKSADSVTL